MRPNRPPRGRRPGARRASGWRAFRFCPCVLIMSVQPCERKRASVSPSHCCPAASRPVAGSSRSSSPGPGSSARAMVRRWRMPRENPRTRSACRPASPADSIACATRSRGESSSYSRAKSSRFSSAVRSSYKSILCATRPTPLAPVPFARENSTLPALGRIRRAAIFSSVVLPEPFAPTRPTDSPGAIRKETPRRANRTP